MKIKTDMFKKHDSLAPGYAASNPFLVLSNVLIPFLSFLVLIIYKLK